MTVSKFIKQLREGEGDSMSLIEHRLDKIEHELDALPKKIQQIFEDAAIKMLESVETGEPRIWTDYISRLDTIKNILETTFYCNLPSVWYRIVKVAGEMSGYINPRGLLIEADVPASSSYTYNLDLTATQYICLCPIFTCESEYGGRYSKLTILVNETPVDVKESEWINKYAHENMPIPTEAPPLNAAYDFVTFPKRKVKFTFSNSHSSENHMVFYTDWFKTTKDWGTNLIENCYRPFKAKVIDEFLKEVRP